MKTKTLTRMDPVSTAKVFGLLYLFIGVFAGILFALVSVFSPKENGFGLAFAIGAPIFYGGLGFVGTLIGCFCYNVVAGWVGGIQYDVEE